MFSFRPSMLRDAIRLLFRETIKAWEVCELDKNCDLPGWRQADHLLRSLQSAYRAVETNAKSKNLEAVQSYLLLCTWRIQRCDQVLQEIEKLDPNSAWISRLESASELAWTLHDQVERRLVKGEKIPSDEKIYSLHARHTRWIQKGKSGGKKVELGVPVSIIENDHRFILMWQIMWTECDVAFTVDLVDQCKKTYPNVHAMSFDRSYSSKPNMKALTSRLKHVILPKKGKLSKEDRARESAPEFKKRRRKHAQVESRINCLEQHGGDRIRTKGGKAGFARTVGASVVATNLCRMGALLQERQYLEWRQAA